MVGGKGCWEDQAEPQLSCNSTLSRAGVDRSRDDVKRGDMKEWKENGEHSSSQHPNFGCQR